MLAALGQMADPQMLRLLAKTAAITLVLFAILGTVAWFALDRSLAWIGVGNGLFLGADGLRGVASLVLVLIGAWLLWRILAMAVIAFYADEVVLAVERKDYPEAYASARDLSVPAQLRTSLTAGGRALLINLIALPFALLLLVTGIGTTLLFWIVNAVLIGRELSDMVWLRHRHIAGAQSPLSATDRLAVGGATAALMLVPVICFVAPLFGAASATHLTHRKRNAVNASR